jgi:hypothetical protein
MDLVLDHIGVGVRDLDRGSEAYSRLGFALTPRSVHRGSLTPGGPVAAWGSANRCAMFDDGYLEVIGPSAPQDTGTIRDMVDRYEGAHIVAIGCADSQKMYEEMSALGLPVLPPRLLERDAPYGVSGDETRPASFRNAPFDPAVFGEGKIFYIQHVTPDVLWQPHQLTHPNGVSALTEIYFCAPGAEAVATKFAPMLRSDPEQRGAGDWRLPLTRGAVRILEPDAWDRLAPGQATPEPPAPVGIGLRVASLDQARGCIEASGIVLHDGERPGEWPWVGAEDGCGTVLFFTEE